jgi:hypothetical protein
MEVIRWVILAPEVLESPGWLKGADGSCAGCTTGEIFLGGRCDLVILAPFWFLVLKWGRSRESSTVASRS